MVYLEHGEIVLEGGVGVKNLLVHVTEPVIGSHNAAKLAVTCVIEPGVSGEHEESPGLVSPPDDVLAQRDLYDRVDLKRRCLRGSSIPST